MSLARSLRRLWNRNRRVPTRRNRVLFEPLEPRLLLDATVAHWIGESGNWSDPTNWDIGVVPNDGGGNTYTVIIDLADSDPVVDVDQAITISGLATSETIRVDSGRTLATSGTVTNTGNLIAIGGTLKFDNATVTNTSHTITVDGGTVEITNSTINGGTLQATGAGGAVSVLPSGTLDGVMLNADLMLGSGGFLTVKNGLELNSRLTLTSIDYAGAFLYFDGTQTLSGTGEVIFSAMGSYVYNSVYVRGDGGSNPATLTIGPGITIHGNQSGEVRGLYANDTLINQGTISADTSGKTITVSGANWTNAGLLKAENGGTLNLAGTFTQTGLGTFDATNGTVNITGTLDNSGTTLALSGATGSLNLASGGMIKGGTVTGTGGAQLIPTGGTLDGVTLAADTTITNGNVLTVKNGLALNSALTLTSVDYADAFLYFDGTQTLSGTGEVIFSATGSYVNNQLYIRGGGGSNPATLTIGPGITIHGSQSGEIRGLYANDTLINQGTINADTSGKTITVSAANWRNSGLLKAQNGGTLNLAGTFTQTGLGTFDATDGKVNITGTLDNSGTTLALSGATGSLNLASGGMIKGGTVTGTGGVQLIPTGGTLDGVTLAADVKISGSMLRVKGGLTLNSTLTIESIDYAGAYLFFEGTQTLSGTGEILFTSAGFYVYNSIFAQGGGGSNPATLTIGPGITIHGSESGEVRGLYSNDTLINQGTINADTSGKTITVSAANWRNSGLLKAQNGGTLNLAGTFTQTGLGTFDATDGKVNITGTLDNSGTTLALSADTGSLNLSSGGMIKGGTVTGTGGVQLIPTGGTLDGVTLAADVKISGSMLRVKGGLTLNSTLTIESIDYAGAFLYFEGTQTLSGTGEILFTSAGFYVYNSIYAQGDGGSNPATLTIGPGITIHGSESGEVRGLYSNDTLINQGTINADTSGKTITVSAANWTNSGLLKAQNGGTLNLAGTFTQTGLGTFDATNGTVNITGTLDNSGTTLALSGATGSLNLASGGMIKGGTVTGTGGAQLIPIGGTLDGVTLAADVKISGSMLRVKGGLTLNSTLTIESIDYAGAFLYFEGTQTLSGTGEILFTSAGFYVYNSIFAQGDGGSNPATLTIGPGITIHGNRSGEIRGLYSADTVINEGSVEAENGASIDLNGSVKLDGLNRLAGQESSTISISGDLVGGTRNADKYMPLGTTRLDGSGTESSPQLLEVMSLDLGTDSAGFNRNFTYATLAFSNNTYVRLVDQSDNAVGAGTEALYVNSLLVPVGTTLDLNGLHLYARTAQVSGTIVGGSLQQIADSGSIVWGTATPGSIGEPGELDEWTFFGRAGRSVTVVLNPGSGNPPAPFSPHLGNAQVQLMDANSNILATVSSGGYGQDLVLTDVALPADGNYRIQVRASADYSASTGNYLVTLWDVTADISPLVLNQQYIGLIETPYSVDRWTFSAVAGQQVRFDLVNTSAAGVVFDLTGPSSWTGFSDIAADFDLVTLPTSGNYTLTAHGTGGQYGGTYAFRLQETIQTVLPLDTPYNGVFAGSGQAQLFRVDVPVSMPMRVMLDDSSAADQNELYVKFGAPPTRGDYDYRYSTPATADQQILVPMATAGTWYLLVYGDLIPASSDYTLLATTSGLIVTGVTPDHHGNTVAASLTLTGAGFDLTTDVELVGAGGTSYSASEVGVDSFTQITATFAAGIPAGTYSLRLSQPDGDSDELANAFEVIAGGQPNLVTNLVVPNTVGRHANATIYVEYANTGQVAMPAPLLVLDGSADRALMTLDQSQVAQGFWTSGRPESFSDTIQILASGETAGVLQPGESFKIPVYFIGLEQPWDFSDNQVEFNLGVLMADNTSTVDWNSLKDSMRPPTIDIEAWEPIWANFVTQTGDTWGDYLAMLDDNAAYLGRLGEGVVDVGQLLSFEFQQADGLNPVRTLSSAVDTVVEAPGFPITFSRVFAEPISQRYEQGPLGYGWSHNWEYSLVTQADGTVKINGPGGSVRTFQPDSRHAGSYFGQAGDHGTLSAVGGGVFTLRETDGLLYAFRSDGKLDYVEDTNHNRITAGYTGDQLTSLTHSSGQTLQIAYNAAGLIESVTDQIGRQTAFTYDAANEHVISAQDYEGKITAYTYITGQGAPSEHGLASIEYPGGTLQYFTYDTQGRLASIYRDGNAETVSFSYDSTGKVIATNALGDSTKFYFDYRGLLVKTEDALGNAFHLSFDNAYNLTAVTDPTGRSYTYSYDAKGNLIRSTDPLGNTASFTYTGAFNRLASVTDANGNSTAYAYDANGNLTSITYADRSVERWDYDSLGEPTNWTNRRGHEIGYTYDTYGRITSKLYGDGSHVDYTYDARGNLLTATDSTGTTAFTYDPENDYLTRIDYPGREYLIFTYDTAGRRASSLDQLGHQLDYHYDSAGRLDYIENESSLREVDYDYDAAGGLIRKTLGNGVYTTYAYDAAGQLLHLINYKPDDSVLSRFDYTYDSLGRRTSMDTLDGTWTYEYDDIGQLAHAVFDSTNPDIPDQDLTYIYDALGNRIRTLENGVTTNYTTNNMNQYTQVGDTTYIFDADGNLIQEISPQGTTSYTYNDESRLVAVTSPDGTWQYTYDALGDRIATTENGVTTRYVIDPIGLGNLVGEYDSSGNLIAHYDYGYGLMSRTAGVSATYYTFDAIGNTVELTNAVGSILNSYAYNPFGVTLQANQTIANPFELVGDYGVMNEGSGLSFMRARYFDEQLGRFITEDPIGLKGNSLNLYQYASNDPISASDPIGLTSHFNTSDIDFFDTEFPDIRFPGFGREGVVYDPRGPGGKVVIPVVFDTPFTRTPEGEESTKHHERQHFQDLMEHGMTREPGDFGLQRPHPLPRPGSIVPPNPPTKSLPSGGSGVSTSGDPNQKIGPAGFSTAGYISPDGTFGYRIDFENEPSATAPAQGVVITDQLDSELDWTTFELTEIGFGDQLIVVPDNVQHYETTVPMSYNGLDFEVQIEAGINASTGQVYATFQSIDPNTSLPPNVLTGFLPPEDGTGRGMGHISYTIDPKGDLATCTEIRNVALISFDGQPQIATNQIDPHDPSKGTDPTKECLNTIDAGTPSSNVLPLPATTIQSDLLVQWTGEDDTGGSGIASYDICISADGGAYMLWMDDTAETSATYTGQYGHSYAFYSIARDHVGHVESIPSAPDAYTIVLPTNTAPVAADDAYNVDEDSVLMVAVPGLLANDTDVEKDPLTAVLVAGPTHGNLTLNADGAFTYTPALNFNGADSFTYKANDGAADSNVATVALTITPVNDAPVAEGDAYSTNEDTLLRVAPPGLLGNDTDVDIGDVLTVVSVDTASTIGNVIWATDGSFTYDPNGQFEYLAVGETATDSFTYAVSDGYGGADTAAVTVTITGVNDAPVAVKDSVTTTQNTPVTIAVLANDYDVDGDTLSIQSFTPASNGTVVDNKDGTLTFIPASGFMGDDSFSYTVSDGQGGSASANVAITVTPTEEVVIDAGAQAGDGTPDTFRLVRNGANLEIWVNGIVVFATPFASAHLITFSGSADNDGLIIDYIGGNPIPSEGITYDGMAGVDQLVMTGGAASKVTHTFSSISSGMAEVDGSIISYTNIEAITDGLSASDRTFLFGGGSDTVTIGDDGVANNNMSRISSAASSVAVNFMNPVNSLTVNAGEGNDCITVGALDEGAGIGFAVVIDAGAGDDYVDGSRADFNLTLIGGSGKDTLLGGRRGDVLIGDDGNDILKGGNGDDTLLGGSGNDVLDGGTGNDVLRGGDGIDFITGGSGNDTLYGDAGNDILTGGNGDDVITAGDGDDLVSGDNGNDTLLGGNGNDMLMGGNGDDVLRGEAGNDILLGGPGDDLLDGGPGNNVVFDPYGKNRIIRGSSSTATLLQGNPGVNAAPGSSGLIDLSIQDLNISMAANRNLMISPSAPWISDFVTGLATRNDKNPNDNIQVVLLAVNPSSKCHLE